MSPYSAEVIRQTEMTAPLNSIRIKKKFEMTNYANGDINYIGNFCFAYSGSQVPNSTLETTLMEFTTGPSFLKGTASFDYDNEENMRIRWRLYLNDVIIAYPTVRYQDTDVNPTNVPDIIIPPFSVAKFTAQENSATTDELFARFVGQVYSGAEIIQGAI